MRRLRGGCERVPVAGEGGGDGGGAGVHVGVQVKCGAVLPPMTGQQGLGQEGEVIVQRGSGGGKVVVTGTPEQVAKNPKSIRNFEQQELIRELYQ